MPASNKRFGEIGGEVIVRISVRPLTLCDNPNCVQLTPQLRQAAGTLPASGRTQRADYRDVYNKLMFNKITL